MSDRLQQISFKTSREHARRLGVAAAAAGISTSSYTRSLVLSAERVDRQEKLLLEIQTRVLQLLLVVVDKASGDDALANAKAAVKRLLEKLDAGEL